jgi:hypothetical protein
MLEIQRNKRVVVEQHRDAWGGGNPEAVDRYCAPKAICHFAGRAQRRRRDQSDHHEEAQRIPEKVEMIIAEGAHVEGAPQARRLAAIVCMDVASYSLLMGADEEGTLARIEAIQHGVIEPALAARRAASP